MNIYAAAVLLRYIDVSTFVDMSPEERLGQFSIMLGEKRVVRVSINPSKHRAGRCRYVSCVFKKD